MLFLVEDDAGCAFTNPFHLSLPAVSMTRIAGESPEERVATALAAVAMSDQMSATERALWLVQATSLDDRSHVRVLRPLLASQNEDIRLAAASALLSRNDLTGLDVAEPVLLETMPTSSDRLGAARAGLGRLSSPVALPFLTRLLKSPDVLTRRAAVDAVRRIASPRGAETLVIGLDDVDMVVQYTSVIALAEINEQRRGIPSIETFRRAPEEFIAYWKEWAARRSTGPR